MRYLGGKARLVGKFALLVNARSANRTLWEPFCGGLNASVRLEARRHILSDAEPCLVTLVRAVVLEGWLPDLNAVSKALWERHRANPDPDDPMTAFLGYGCSFSGKWFSTYAGFTYDSFHMKRGNHGSAVRSGPLVSVKSLLKARFALDGREVEVERCDFLDGTRPDGVDVIYADPPYRGTTGYDAVPGEFDSDRFWEVASAHAADGVDVFVSERTAPVGWAPVWTGGRRRILGGSPGGERLDEALFRRRRPRVKRLASEEERDG